MAASSESSCASVSLLVILPVALPGDARESVRSRVCSHAIRRCIAGTFPQRYGLLKFPAVAQALPAPRRGQADYDSV
jgi:hypothetical protein